MATDLDKMKGHGHQERCHAIISLEVNAAQVDLIFYAHPYLCKISFTRLRTISLQSQDIVKTLTGFGSTRRYGLCIHHLGPPGVIPTLPEVVNLFKLPY